MPIIIMVILIMYIVLISWCFHNLGTIEKAKKILYIAVCLVFLYIATNITFMISSKDIAYPNQDMLGAVKYTLVCIFTGINGIFVMPFVSSGIDKADQGTISQEKLLKRIFASIIFVIILLIFECGYMFNIQQGILEIINSKS